MAAVRQQPLGFLPILLMGVFALSRWPGLMPENFSAVYSLVFCAGVFFSGRVAWYLPLLTLAMTDVVLNVYYQAKGWEVFTLLNMFYLTGNYMSYAVLILLGRWFRRLAWNRNYARHGIWQRLASWLTLVAGSVFGAILFYLITNTMAWLFNPFHNIEYTKTLAGWFQALTGGTAGWPQTWQFFKSTLGSSSLFTGLFAGAMHLADALEKQEDMDEEDADESQEPVETGEREPQESPV